ncbi:helix-hairpin-helix domain-containing protein [Rubrolithibacter danxiaensis]|uniref:helix-hairpin-helix domain-containing protein n=1 Tax=Rubrolithibacter danxiaensis TaxID=3390805 RepID=UPI003BF85BBB
MENKFIARTLRFLSQLMELHDENAFKVKSLSGTAYKVDKLPFSIATKSLKEIEEINGIGKSTGSKIWELITTNTIKELESLLEQTPPGVVEMLRIKGIGPKKVSIIWKELCIENVGELLYACNENRLIEAKGFGLKTQEEIRKSIEFKIASSGLFLYAQAEELAEAVFDRVKKVFADAAVSFTGAYRRRCEIIESVDILIGNSLLPKTQDELLNIFDLKLIDATPSNLKFESEAGLKFNLYFCKPQEFGSELALTTGNEAHVIGLKTRLNDQLNSVAIEKDLYEKAGLPFIEPELREGLKEFEWAEKNELPQLVSWEDLKGTLHNHSTWSDGVHTLEEMAVFCRDGLKLEYLGICDHSKSAFYANGLNELRVIAQHKEIDQLNAKLDGFKIFKGIESDILYDGSLDYPQEILSTFDFVVASVHSILKMNEEKATSRLITAIENPFTTILGHATGRMLLTRSGYPIDYKKVIDACAANNVVIEINSNPLRLDMDWRWHWYAIEKGVLLSINPDAHRKEGFYDTHYGVLAARKGGVSAKNCLNALNQEEITTYFNRKRSLNKV